MEAISTREDVRHVGLALVADPVVPERPKHTRNKYHRRAPRSEAASTARHPCCACSERSDQSHFVAHAVLYASAAIDDDRS